MDSDYSWVLKEQASGLFFQHMAPIGPRLTPEIEKAAHFESKDEACRSPAFGHGLTFFEPIRADDAEEDDHDA